MSPEARVALAETQVVARLSPLQKGFQAWEEFVTFAFRKFGNPVRLWFVMDPDEHMKIGEMQFARACEEIGYRGGVTALWRYLDMDGSGHITLQEIDSASAVRLAKFKRFLNARFAGSVAQAMRALDLRTERVPKAHFIAGLRKLGYNESGKKLFDSLVRSAHTSFLLVESMSFLERWNPPPYLLSDADQVGLGIVKETLGDLYQNLLRAWLHLLDTDRTMRVSWEEWQQACRKISKKAPTVAGLPKTEGQMAAVWRALDADCSGWIALREFDLTSFEALATLKRWVDREHCGSVSKVMRMLEKQPNSTSFTEEDSKVTSRSMGQPIGISRSAFRSCLKHDVGLSREHSACLTDGLDIKDDRGVTDMDLKFLERWDLAWEEEALGASIAVDTA